MSYVTHTYSHALPWFLFAILSILLGALTMVPPLHEITTPENSVENDHLVDALGATIQSRWEMDVPPPAGFSRAQAVITWKKDGRQSTIDARLYLHRPGIFDASGAGSMFRIPTGRVLRALTLAADRAHQALTDAWNDAVVEEE